MTRLSFGVSDDTTGLIEWHEQVEESESTNEQHEPFVLWHETKLLFNIALPAVAVQLSVLFIFPQTASVVGRTMGTDALAGFSLGSLVGNLTCLSVMVGCLTAADTLMPRAYGTGHYDELGRLAIRGFIICSLLLLAPIVPLCTIMEWVFDQLGQDEHASHLASEWIRVYLIGVPAMLLFRVIQSFLNAQHQVWPLVYASMAACFIVHPIFLNFFIPAFGFVGSSLAIAMTQYAMAFFLLLYLKIKPVHKAESWPGLSQHYIMEAISPRPMARFFSLSLGGVLSLSVS
jgi:MATE family multidrug resistance protein